MRKHICSCALAFGSDSTSALSGHVRPDEGQRPLNMLFLPILLGLRGHPEVGKKEGELPAGLFDVLTAVHSVGQGLCAVLCPQAEGSQRRERGEERRADGCTAGARAEFLGVSERRVKICCFVFQTVSQML